MAISEDLRQRLGEALSAKLYNMQQEVHPNEVDWCYADNVDEVIDAIAPLLTQEDHVQVPTSVQMAHGMLALATSYLQSNAPAGARAPKELPDVLSVALWLYRRLPAVYGQPHFVDTAILAMARRTGVDVTDSLEERAKIAASHARPPRFTSGSDVSTTSTHSPGVSKNAAGIDMSSGSNGTAAAYVPNGYVLVPKHLPPEVVDAIASASYDLDDTAREIVRDDWACSLAIIAQHVMQPVTTSWGDEPFAEVARIACTQVEQELRPALDVLRGSDETQSVKVDERALFEAHMRGKTRENSVHGEKWEEYADYLLKRPPNGDYTIPWVDAGWEYWQARAALAQQAAPGAPTGYKLVPLEPTPAMLTALWNRRSVSAPVELDEAYAAMLAVAPAPATQQAGSAVDNRYDLQHARLSRMVAATCGNSHQSPYEPAQMQSAGGIGKSIVDAATTVGASIDTPKFRKLLCNVFGVEELTYSKALPALVAHIESYRTSAPSRDAASDAPVAEEVRDAARYRFLRHADLDELARVYWPDADVPEGDELDAILDAAMSAAQGKAEEPETAFRLDWTPPAPPDGKEFSYDHTYAMTPFGRILITWKSWKDMPDYTVDEHPVAGMEFNIHGNDLDDAKRKAEDEYFKAIRVSAISLSPEL